VPAVVPPMQQVTAAEQEASLLTAKQDSSRPNFRGRKPWRGTTEASRS
jgi:hypothetical protein